MRKSLIKNIIICVLFALCAALTIRLWFGDVSFQSLFPVAPVEAAANPHVPHQELAHMMIESAIVTININGSHHETIFASVARHDAWDLASAAIAALIENGALTQQAPEINTDIVIQYNFPMPSGFFREFFGRRAGFLSEVMPNFEVLTISPCFNDGAIFFTFTNSAGANVFLLESAELSRHFYDFFANAEPANQLENTNILWSNPVGSVVNFTTVRPFIEFLFPNPSAIIPSTINQVFTYRDNLRVVRFFPNNVMMFNTMGTRAAPAASSFTSSFLAALDMINNDQAPINDVVFVRYRHSADTDEWVFYFDYVVENMPVNLEYFDHPHPHCHAIEVRVRNNSVTWYRRLMLMFHVEHSENYYEY